MGLSVQQIAVDGFDHNFSYVIADAATKQALIVDPSGVFGRVKAQVEEQSLQVVGILITHTHHDHIDCVAEAIDTYGVPVYAQQTGALPLAARSFARTIDDESTLPLGESLLIVWHTPGHSPDAVCYFIAAAQAADGIPKLVTGDTLFVGRCGRTNEHDVADLYASLQRLLTLPNETVVYPGHDYGETPTSTIGHERTYNTYLHASDLDTFIEIRLRR